MGHTHSVTDYPGHIAGIAAISAVVGAATALFITPRNGEEVRQGIKRRASNMRSNMKNKGEQLSETITDKKEDIKDSVSKTTEDAKKAAKEAKDKQ